MSLASPVGFDNVWQVLLTSGSWQSTSPGSLMVLLGTSGYTPNKAHSTVGNIGANYLTSGQGAPRAIMNPTVGLSGVAPIKTGLLSDAINFGTVSLTAKYAIVVKPVVAGTLAASSKLLFYIDLNKEGGNLVLSNQSLVITPASTGWLHIKAPA